MVLKSLLPSSVCSTKSQLSTQCMSVFNCHCQSCYQGNGKKNIVLHKVNSTQAGSVWAVSYTQTSIDGVSHLSWISRCPSYPLFWAALTLLVHVGLKVKINSSTSVFVRGTLELKQPGGLIEPSLIWFTLEFLLLTCQNIYGRGLLDVLKGPGIMHILIGGTPKWNILHVSCYTHWECQMWERSVSSAINVTVRSIAHGGSHSKRNLCFQFQNDPLGELFGRSCHIFSSCSKQRHTHTPLFPHETRWAPWNVLPRVLTP